MFVGDWQNGASGSRLAFAPDGLLYITTGAPFGDQAQDRNTVYGKVLRLKDDGTVPKDNPFARKPGTRPEIYSMGHRDQLGLTIHAPTGRVLTAEHGPNGGDEINLIVAGRNYGWPRVSFGRDYQGPRISESPIAPDVEQPIVLSIPSLAACPLLRWGPRGLEGPCIHTICATAGTNEGSTTRIAVVPRRNAPAGDFTSC